MSWANCYAAGIDMSAPVPIRRFSVDQERDVRGFNRCSEHLVAQGTAAAIKDQEEWMRQQGPMSTRLFDYLQQCKDEYDAFIFFGYLYATTYFGLPIVQDKACLAPLAHDEWPIYLTMWEAFFQLPQSFIFQTAEEKRFVHERFPNVAIDGPITGIGIERPVATNAQDFRRKYNVFEDFLLYVGRIDAAKGCDELFAMFLRQPKRGSKLVLIGPEVLPVPFDDDIVHVGYVSDQEKWSAMACCRLLVMPSPHESLSIALLETWSVGRPAIVTARSKVLVDHCRKSNGGLWYHTADDWAAALEQLDEVTMEALGRNGQRYVEENYCWPRVEAEYLNAITSTRTR
jgi:glycosyltransferase involved in cell wall biosynthesis